MRGGFLHNQALVAPIERAFRALGAMTRREVPDGPGRQAGYIDLVAHVGTRRIAVEVELSARRVQRDLVKAQRFGADELWIVVPCSSRIQAVKREARRYRNRSSRPVVFFLTLGQATQRVRSCFPLFSPPNVGGKQINGDKELVPNLTADAPIHLGR